MRELSGEWTRDELLAPKDAFAKRGETDKKKYHSYSEESQLTHLARALSERTAYMLWCPTEPRSTNW